ncbi:MAG: aspartate 1-decarboxylase [Candidatus Firestonebacteria bacterium]|nr:aspartate 1-decarboxylase [Candidatus Firestonebacteria bacterium]
MLLQVLKSKIHRAIVTEANLEYEGSITIDEDLLNKAQIIPYEKLQIVNLSTGHRFETYCIPGPKKSGMICLNGGTARLGASGDKIIIISYMFISKEELINYKPLILRVDDNNKARDE